MTDRTAIMEKLTNFQLAYLGGVVLVLLGSVTALYLFDNSEKLLTIVAVVVGLGVLSPFAAATLQTTIIKDTESVWLRPVSPKIETILMNSVVSLFLFGELLLISIMLMVRHGAVELVTVACLVPASIVLGRSLRRRFSPNSLLAYAITTLGALMLIIVVVAIFGSLER